MIEADNSSSYLFTSPGKRADSNSKVYKYQKESLEMRKRLDEKDVLIQMLQRQLNEVNRQLIYYKNEQQDYQRKFIQQDEYIISCKKIIKTYEQANQNQNRNECQESKVQLPNIAMNQQDFNIQGVNISQKKTMREVRNNNDSSRDRERNMSKSKLKVERHFETSSESKSNNDVTSPRNNYQTDNQINPTKENINSSKKTLKSESKSLKTSYFFDEQDGTKQVKQFNYDHMMNGNRSVVQLSNNRKKYEGQSQQQHGSQSLSNINKKQNQLRNSLQDIHYNHNGMYLGGNVLNMASNFNIPPSVRKGKIQELYSSKDNIFSRQNLEGYHFKSRQLDRLQQSQIKSTPDLSLIKVPMSKLQKINSKEIKRRINKRVETQFQV